MLPQDVHIRHLKVENDNHLMIKVASQTLPINNQVDTERALK